jgi:DNA-binding NarL/FixJ family response regulator
MSTTSAKRVFLVDDHALVREGLTNLIAQHPDLTVCGEAEDAPSAFSRIETLRPDVAVVDLSLKGESGLDLIERLRTLAHPPAILVLSMHDELAYAERAIRSGALGYVMKREISGKVIQAIRDVGSGKLHVSKAVADDAAERFLRDTSPGGAAVSSLSEREFDVFRRIGVGMENRQIAEDLHISMKTVQTHCDHIKRKLGLANGTLLIREAVLWVERHGAAGASAS